MLEAYRVAIQTAFIAIASRIVGSGFRVAETYNPALKKAGIVMKPDVVIKRELITMGLAWCFALATNLVIAPIGRRMGVNRNLVTFLTSLIGTATAETVARTVAYRNLNLPGERPLSLASVVPAGGRGAFHGPVNKSVMPHSPVPMSPATRSAYAYRPQTGWGQGGARAFQTRPFGR